MTNYLMNGEFLSSEWMLVLAVGLVFFLIQIALCIAFNFGIRRQERAIKRLCRDFNKRGDGRSGIQALSANHAWLHWVAANFPAKSTDPAGKLSREDALEELDTRIASNGNYLLLQRMGVMAPLLGVVLTVAGFYWLQVRDDDQSLQAILKAVAPLVSGVGTGALLALINQALLHLAGRRVESLRMTARTWFDAVIWSRYASQAPATPVTAADMMELFINNALADVDRLGDTLARAAEINAAIATLPDQIRKILDRKISSDHKPAPTASTARLVTPLPRSAPATMPVSSTRS